MFTVFIIVIGMLAVYVAFKMGAWQSHQGTRWASRRERVLSQELLRKALGDQALVERLIALEGKKHPQAGREECMQHAIDAWKRHNQ